MVLQGENIMLVSYTIERCHAFFNEYVADLAMTYDTYTYDKDKVDRYFQDKVLDTNRIFFAIIHNDKIIGEIQIKQIDLEKQCGTLSVHLINDTFKGKGYGTEAQRLIINYAINTIGLKTIYANVTRRNYRSKHVLRKLGFEYIYNDDNFTYFKFSVK